MDSNFGRHATLPELLKSVAGLADSILVVVVFWINNQIRN
jgi:hypothetical protein